MPMQCYVHVKSQSREKKTGSSIEKLTSFVLPGSTTTVTAAYYLISSLLSVSGCLREVKNQRKFQNLALKVIAVAYERCSLTRGSQCSDLIYPIQLNNFLLVSVPCLQVHVHLQVWIQGGGWNILKYWNNIWFLWHHYKNSPPISKSWICPWPGLFKPMIKYWFNKS